MSFAISSAQPAQLYRYADVARRIDHELAAEGNSLGAHLRHFEAACRESGYSISASYLADALRAYAYAVEPMDCWVQTVGRGFERADERSMAQAVAQWVKGALAAIFRPRGGGSYSLIDRYAGVVLRPRGNSPLALQSQALIDRLITLRSSVSTRWLSFVRVDWALTRVIWPIRFLILTFHWVQFWRPLPWLGTATRPIEPTPLPPSPTPLGELLTPLSDPVEPTVGEIRLGEHPVEPWTPEDARNFVLRDHGRLPGTEQCVAWATERAAKISGMSLVAISTYNKENWGAHNYIDIYADSVIRFSRENAQATLAAIGAGAVLVYDAGQARMNPAYGHVAVIERIEPGGVWVSDSNYAGSSPRFISTEDLIRYGLYVIPAGASPVSNDRYEASRRRRGQQSQQRL